MAAQKRKGNRKDEVFILVNRSRKVRDINRCPADELVRFIRQGFLTYASAEEAEDGRRAGDAYEEPWRTKVVGFRVSAFLPSKER